MRNYESYEGNGWEPQGTRPYVEQLEGEPDAHYQQFASFVGGFKNAQPLNRKDARATRRILTFGRALAYRTSAGILSHPDVVPLAVRNEWEAHQSGSRPVPAYREGRNVRWRRIGVGGAIAAVAAGLTVAIGLTAQGGESNDHSRKVVAQSADSLRALGICAADMRMQLQYDQTKDVSNGRARYVKGEVKIDLTAIKTATEANLPCVKQPDESAFVVVQEPRSQRAVDVSLYRLGMTEFVAANWQAQSEAFQHQINIAGEDGDYKEYQQKIDAGNAVMQSLGGVNALNP